MSSFVHLHNHSHYSLLDGATKIDALIQATQDQGLNAVALTDHGNMFGAAEFYLKCKDAGLKPIVGMEAYQAINSRHDRGSESGGRRMGDYYHLILLAKNAVGYKNLCQLSTIAYLEGFYYKPRIDMELLERHHEGIICMSACLKGEIPQLLLSNRIKEARAAVDRYREVFGDDYYLELQDHGIEEQVLVRKRMVELAREMSVPMVVTNDEHYIKKEHAKSQEVMLCINSGKDINDPTRLKFSAEEMYYKTPQQMEELFHDLPDALENTALIAGKCDFDWDMHTHHLPRYPLPEGEEGLDAYLGKLARRGLEQRYADITPALRQRLEYELGIINKMGFPGYFLIVKDFIDYARSQDIPVGPGRGSAAGSLVSYCLGITNLDPIKYDLIFERFLNPERLSMPDIDIDFCYERRDEIMKYVVEKYGQDKVAQIITFGSMNARAVIRDVGRVLKIPLDQVDHIAKLVPGGPGITLEKAFKEVPELAELSKKAGGPIEQLLQHARALEGLARHSSTHAAGVVIAPTALTDYLPLYKAPASKQAGGSELVTQFTMTYVEKIGLLKMDFLGLRTLTVMYDTVAMLRQRRINLDLDGINLNDQPTFDLFSRGETVGCFQFESSGMREYLRKLKPTCVEDLIAMNALYRPGPMDLIDDFIDRKHGRKAVTYLHPVLEPILKETYGVIVYQEQVIRIASDMAGFSLGQGDILRRAMGKKKKSEMASQQKTFVDGAGSKGIPENVADEVFALIDKFAGYGFNKSHAAAYAYVAYQTAYLKANYPAEFMASLMTSEMNSTDRIQILMEEARHMGLDILPPDVNESHFEFTVIKGKIRFGLGAVKNVGESAIESMVAAREKINGFRTIFDFTSTVDLRLVNRKVVESLIEVGAMDSLEGNRRSKMDIVELAIAFGHEQQYRSNHNQTTFFGESSSVAAQQPVMPELEDFTPVEKLNRERELLGFYVTGHPLDRYREELRAFVDIPLNQLEQLSAGRKVWIGGMISVIKEHIARGGKKMAFVTLEDFTGSGEIIIFAEQLEQFGSLVQPDACLLVYGEVSKRSVTDTGKMICQRCVPLETSWKKMKASLYIRLDPEHLEKPLLERVIEQLKKYEGASAVKMEMMTPENHNLVFHARRYMVQQSKVLLKDLRNLLGECNVWFSHNGGNT